MKMLRRLLLLCVFLLQKNVVFGAIGDVAVDKKITEPYYKKLEFCIKNKTNLTMVLGAGDHEENYTRFKDYTFLVTNGEDGPKLCEEKIQKFMNLDNPQAFEKSLPLPLIFDFNSDAFLTFLKEKMPGKFSKIIFDYSVTKSLTKA